MSDLPYFQFFPQKWLNSVAIEFMSPAEEGAYVRLLAVCWVNGGFLPDDDKYLAVKSRLFADWEKSKNKIRKEFTLKDGKLYQKLLTELHDKAVGDGVTKSVIAKSRWSKQKYFESEKLSYEKLITDTAWLETLEKYHPDIDIKLTLEKAHSLFWATEDGYNYFASKNNKIKNWRLTYQKAISITSNQVKKQGVKANGNSYSKTGLHTDSRKNIGRPGFDENGRAIGAQAKPGECDEGVLTLAGVRHI